MFSHDVDETLRISNTLEFRYDNPEQNGVSGARYRNSLHDFYAHNGNDTQVSWFSNTYS